MWDDGNSLKLLRPDISLLVKMKISSMVSAYDKELAIEDNQMKPGNGHWENEYQHQYNAGPSSWTISFRGPANERVHHGPFNDQWFDEISKLHVNDWAAEFGRQVGEGILGDDSADNWANTYDD
ncbi:hypothetical protein Tco_1259785 [Tanacetum coccineum]